MSGRDPVRPRSRWLPWMVLVVAGPLLVGSVAFAGWGVNQTSPPVAGYPSGPAGSSAQPWTGPGLDGRTPGGPGGPGGLGGMMGASPGDGMMGGHLWLAGDGSPVPTIAAARARAAQAGAHSGLKPGEVMQFSLNFYVELKDASGASTAEVLVDPASGAVVTEYGPATMWTTSRNSSAMPADRATTIANQWLQANAVKETVGSTDAYPGYFTMDTVAEGNTVGMLSVNAATGAVWNHTWHGTFIAKEDV